MQDKTVAQKITAARIKALTEENRELKRKVADNRIAVRTLNEIAVMYTDFLMITVGLLADNNIPQTPEAAAMISRIRNYAKENYGARMEHRIAAILDDTTGDEVLFEDLFNPPEGDTHA